MKKIIISFCLSAAVFLLFSAIPVLADGSAGCPVKDCPAGATCLCNPLSTDSPQVLIGQIINSVMGIVGSIALLMFIFGGLTWMTSGGSAEKVKKGRDIIIWSAIGLVVIFFSYGLIYFLIRVVK